MRLCKFIIWYIKWKKSVLSWPNPIYKQISLSHSHTEVGGQHYSRTGNSKKFKSSISSRTMVPVNMPFGSSAELIRFFSFEEIGFNLKQLQRFAFNFVSLLFHVDLYKIFMTFIWNIFLRKALISPGSSGAQWPY